MSECLLKLRYIQLNVVHFIAAYSDIIQPLLDTSPEFLRQADKAGITPQDILYVWEERQGSDPSGKVNVYNYSHLLN